MLYQLSLPPLSDDSSAENADRRRAAYFCGILFYASSLLLMLFP